MNAKYRSGLWPLPVVVDTDKGEPRKIGVELEFSGLNIFQIVEACRDTLGGQIDRISDYEYVVRDTRIGDFGVELDFAYVKKLGRERNADVGKKELDTLAEDMLALLAKQIVPFEVVSPPIAMPDAWHVENLIQRLRNDGARGTGHAPLYAFGLHLNPQLPDLEPATIVRYLQAFLILFDWLKMRSDIDFSRRITPYIGPFPKDYVRLVCQSDYEPSRETLIDDYLSHNPTRNRVLDLLPLFKLIDESRVLRATDDDRIKARPTFHYRLPNCKIDEFDWGLARPWRDWLQVEALASDVVTLAEARTRYLKFLENQANILFSDWAAESARWTIPELL